MVRIIRFSREYQSKTKLFILNILEKEFGHTGVKRPDIDDIKDNYFANNGCFWLALDGNKIIGTTGLMDYRRGRGFMKRFAVARSYRKRGIGMRLLKTLINFALKNKFKKIYISTSPNMMAYKYYEKRGFNYVKKLPNGMDYSGDSIFMVLHY